MEEEKKILLRKIYNQIAKKRKSLLDKCPSIHKIDDGVVIRFFTSWENCKNVDGIKYREILDQENPDKKTHFFYIPKNSIFDVEKNNHYSTITCFNGKLEITVDGKTTIINAYSKHSVNSDRFEGKSLENSYVLTESI